MKLPDASRRGIYKEFLYYPLNEIFAPMEQHKSFRRSGKVPEQQKV